MSEYQFKGYDWTESADCWGIPRRDENGKYRDEEEVLEDIEKYISDVWMYGSEKDRKKLATEMRAYLEALYEICSTYKLNITPLWEGLLKIKDDRTFVHACIPLLPYMWT